MINKVDVINRNELFEYIEALYSDHYEQAYDQTIHDIFNAVRRRIRRCSAVKRADVIHGRWEKESWHPYQCSNCKATALLEQHGEYHYPSNYCPNCGAKMDLED